MGIKVYYSEISAHKEVKKRQQKVMMILESKHIPYESIDITEAGRESDKDFMLATAKPKGDSKCVLSPQVFNEDVYCGDYDDFELANENDELEKFLNIPKLESNGIFRNGNQNQNGVPIINGTTTSRESSAEKQVEKVESSVVEETTVESVDVEAQPEEDEEEPMSTSSQPPQLPKPPTPGEEVLENVQPDPTEEDEVEEEKEQAED